MNSLKKTARIAGFMYLVFFVTFHFADNGVHSRPVGSVDVELAVNNIMTSEWLYRIGFMCDVLAALFFLLSAWALYVLLKPVNKNLALLFVFLNLGGVAVQCIGLLGEFTAMLLLNNADYLKVFRADQLQAIAKVFLTFYNLGFVFAQLFLGTWLFPLGYLVFKSGFLPKIIGILLLLDGFGILIWFFQFFLFPGHQAIIYPGLLVSYIAEAALCLWLLIKGVKNQRPAVIEAS